MARQRKRPTTSRSCKVVDRATGTAYNVTREHAEVMRMRGKWSDDERRPGTYFFGSVPASKSEASDCMLTAYDMGALNEAPKSLPVELRERLIGWGLLTQTYGHTAAHA